MRIRLGGTDLERDVDGPVRPLAPGVLAVRDGRTVWLHHRGETFRMERAVERPAGGREEEGHDLFAPMPGKVVRVLVSEGDAVSRGTPLVLLEAMKMEHEIRAPRDGTVSRLFRAPGEMVALGDPLVEIDGA